VKPLLADFVPPAFFANLVHFGCGLALMHPHAFHIDCCRRIVLVRRVAFWGVCFMQIPNLMRVMTGL
jgi:hypothetical protein